MAIQKKTYFAVNISPDMSEPPIEIKANCAPKVEHGFLVISKDDVISHFNLSHIQAWMYSFVDED